MSELKVNFQTPKVTFSVEIPVVLFGIPEAPSFDFIKKIGKKDDEEGEEDGKKEELISSDEKFSLTTGALLLGSIALRALKSSY